MPLAPAATPPIQLSLFDDAPPPAGRPDAPTVFRHPQAQRDIRFGEHLVGYELRRARRRSIGFVIGVDGLTVSAPRWVGIGDVEGALREKSAWILRKLHEQRERARRLQAARVDWRDGSTIPFLGRSVVIRLDPQAGGALLDAEAGALRLGLPQAAAPAQIRDAVQSWLQRQARRVFEERCQLFAARLGVRMRRLALSSAATRWGSASRNGSVRLNWRLVHFALPVVDYVVTHELAHLREMNHSAAFWDVVRSVLPEFESARGTLRSEVLPVFD
jgi:predicted metal-dependent hydrolase